MQGGGLDLALACDIRVASANAAFAHPGARLGIITGWSGTQRLPTLISRARAIEFSSTARRVASDKAVEIGLVQQSLRSRARLRHQACESIP